MARLAEIKNAGSPGIAARTVYLNPVHVVMVEPITGGTRITMDDETVFQTTEAPADIVGAIQNSM